MPRKKLFLVHTSATLVPLFEQLCKSKLPGVSVSNMVDDSLIKDVIANGCLCPPTAKRVIQLVAAAEAAGAEYILVTCSSIGRAVETAAGLSRVPVLRVDRPMAEKAVAMGQRIGVIATVQTTLEPTSDLIQRCADEKGKDIKLTMRLCEGAFEALMNGDGEKHDSMVKAALRELMTEVDVITLAQASMARVVDALPDAEKRVQILASPPLAIDYLTTIL
ncbi:MAG TPA: aspartate/glutamate racemase family protein [Pirellula sp.]|nr:aspartate/glutamate racemase family protein [Pirellula sp.]